MLKKFLSIVSCFVSGILCANPVFNFDFEEYKKIKQQQFIIENKQINGRKVHFVGRITANAGVGNSMALASFGDLTRYHNLPLDFKACTIELKFKLTKGLNANKHTVIFAYATDPAYQRRMLTWIKPDGRLEVLFQIYSGKRVEKSFTLTSSALKWQNNKFYTLRISTKSGRTGHLELNGKLLASGENALGFSDLKGPKPELFFGYYPFYGLATSPTNLLNGFIDNVKIWDKELFPYSQSESTPAEDSAKNSATPHLTINGPWSSPFIVGEVPGKLLGTFVRADEKFHKNATRTRFRFSPTALTVDVECPVPADMKAVPGKLWSSGSDAIEIFIQPDPAVAKYYQYAVSLGKEQYAGINMDPNPASRAKSTIKMTKNGFAVSFEIPLKEIALDKITKGDFFKANVVRTGPTCGQYSYWSFAGDNFHSPECFAPVIFGSEKDYFLKKLAAVKKDFNVEKLSSAAQKHTISLQEKILKTSGDPKNFNSLEKDFSALEYSLIREQHKGLSQLIWKPEVWENNFNVSRLARPLKKISLSMPRNSRRMVGLAVSNLENVPFLGQIKVFKFWPFKRKNFQHFGFQPDWDKFHSNIKIYEGICARDESNRKIYDALSPLPLNTLLRIPPENTTPVWLEISSRDLAPGKYSGFLVLKNCDGKGKYETAKLEVTVTEADLSKVHVDHSVCTYVHRRSWHHESFRKFFLDYNYNYLVLVPGNGLYIYWKKGQGNSLIPGDLKQLGDIIDKAVSSGYDIKKLKLEFNLGWNFGLGGSYEKNPKLWEKIMSASIPAWLDYLEKKYGIPHEKVILNPVDEPGGDVDDPNTTNGKTYIWSKFIKKIAPRVKVMNNPHLSTMKDYRRLEKYTDIFLFYRPGYEGKKDFIEYMQSLRKKGKEIWTYSILMKSTPPVSYRRDYWRNLRDGFNAVTTFWDFDDHAGGDGFDANDVTNPQGRIRRTDYGMAYVEFNYGQLLISRRFAAAQQGYQDTRLIFLCRKHLAQLKQKGVDTRRLEQQLQQAIIKGADGTMEEMDKQADIILALSEKIIALNKQK